MSNQIWLGEGRDEKGTAVTKADYYFNCVAKMMKAEWNLYWKHCVLKDCFYLV